MHRKLLILNGLAIIGVAVAHAANWGFDAMFLWTDRYRAVSVPNYDQLGSIAYYALFFLTQLASIAIPAFLFVSGFFIAYAAGGSRSNLAWRTVFSRIKVLIPPFIIWTIVRFLLLRKPPTSLEDLMLPYYYIVLISQFYLLSPFLIPIAKSYWKLLLIGSMLLQFGVYCLNYFKVIGVDFPGLNLMMEITPGWLFPVWIFWFVLGIVTGFHLQSIKSWLIKLKWFYLGATVIFLGLTIVEYTIVTHLAGRGFLGSSFNPSFSRFFYKLMFLLSFIAFDKVVLPYSRQITEIGGNSLGIYFMNQNGNFVAAFLMYHLTPWILGYQILYQPILLFAGLGVPIIILSIAKASPVRQYYRYVFG